VKENAELSAKNTELKSFRTSKRQLDSLKRIGEELERESSWLIRKAVQAYIDQYDEPVKSRKPQK
jgi:predicted DNA-binding protein